MTMCSIYIGSLENFDWEGNWNGNLPAAITRAFPPYRGPYITPFHEWVSKAGALCQQTDFDGFVARVSKAQILDFIEFCYGSDPDYTTVEITARWSSVVKELSALKDEVSTLEDGKLYGLVGECF